MEQEHAGTAIRSRRRTLALWAGIFAFALVAAASFPFVWRSLVNWRYADDIYAAESAPHRRVAIVFGARVYGNGRLSAMVRDRVDTAIDLYNQGKVDKLLFSGDNSIASYNEPADMMAYAIAQGIDPAAIQPDYGGRRTYDTCYRAAHIFQVDEAILVTQRFHLPRALLLCSALGVDSSGVAADRRIYSSRSIAWSESREVPALVVALVDLVRRAPPPILGDPIPLN